MSKTADPIFSIITIALNNINGLQKTYNCLVKQDFSDFEWIVIDGLSSDGTQSWLEALEPLGRDSCWISEKDGGLYDAMNKGIDLAKGEYLLFLNAGDQLADAQILTKLAKDITEHNHPDFLYGDAYEDNDGQKHLKKARHASKYVQGMFTHHQAMLYKATHAKTLYYDLSYKLAADFDYTVRFLEKAEDTLYCAFPICIFESGGVSQQKAGQARNEEFYIRYDRKLCPLFVNLLIWLRQSAAWLLKRYVPGIYTHLRFERSTRS